MKRSITKQSLMKTNFLSKNSIKETNEPIFQQIKNDLLKKKESIQINKNNDEIKIDNTKNENNFKKIENIERKKRQRQRTSRIIQKINIDSYEDTIIKRKLNNKEQIERLTKDLLPKNNNKLNSQNKEMLFKHTDLKDFIRHTLKLDKTEKNENNNQNKDNKTEEEILLKEEENEDNDEQIQKKKKKHINKYDFII
jgi:hypothetical protein